MHAETQLGADNRPSETPLGRLERALGAAREAVIREQDALIDDLAAQTLRFRTVIRLVKEGVAFFDEGGQLVVANKSYAEIYQLGPEATRPGAAAPEPIQRLLRERRSQPVPIAGTDGMRVDPAAVRRVRSRRGDVLRARRPSLLPKTYGRLPGWSVCGDPDCARSRRMCLDPPRRDGGPPARDAGGRARVAADADRPRSRQPVAQGRAKPLRHRQRRDRASDGLCVAGKPDRQDRPRALPAGNRAKVFRRRAAHRRNGRAVDRLRGIPHRPGRAKSLALVNQGASFHR